MNLDEDGYINTDYYINASIDIITRAAEERGQDPRHLTTNDAFALYRRAYNTLFKPERSGGEEKSHLFEPGCNVKYNAENLKRLLMVYSAVCLEFDSLPSVDGLQWLTGVYIDTVEKYVTGARSFVQNIRKDNIQNRLQAFPIGIVTLANNDIDTGLCYNRQNITDRATVSKALNFSDLVRIGENVTQKDNVSRLETAQTQDIVD